MKTEVNVGRVAFTVLVILAVVGGGGAWLWHSGVLQSMGVQRPTNALMVLAPYKYAGTWVFDDERVGLEREPFVGGIPEMIDELVREIPDAENGFRLLFSAQPFPGHTHKLTWVREEQGGNWYYSADFDSEGWLCAALFRYYEKAPPEFYVKAEAR